MDLLFDDTKSVFELSQREPSNPFLHRMLIRTLFPTIEGQLSIVKQMILDWYHLKGCELNRSEFENLIEEPTVFGNSLKTPVLPKYLGLKDNVKFTYAVFALKLGEFKKNIETKSKEWNSFCKAIEIRDRLMHPKAENDILLSEPDMINVVDAWLWFDQTSEDYRNTVTEKFREIVTKKIIFFHRNSSK